MPYEIQYKSRNECLIKYVKGDDPKSKKGFGWPIFIFGLIAVVVLEMNIIVTLIMCFILITWLNKLEPPLIDFEIKLNRPKDLITIQNTEQARPKSMTYPLSGFMGFELSETDTPKKSNHGAYAELYFKFNGAVKSHANTTQNTMMKRDKAKVKNGKTYWKTPIRSTRYPVPLDNAVDIFESMKDWLNEGKNLSDNIEIQSVKDPAAVAL